VHHSSHSQKAEPTRRLKAPLLAATASYHAALDVQGSVEAGEAVNTAVNERGWDGRISAFPANSCYSTTPTIQMKKTKYFDLKSKHCVI
jgi:hypothetical protein